MDNKLIMKYIKEALKIAWDAKAHTSPNPSVGAILIKNGKIIGKGCTQRPGGHHAEIQAIKNATESVEDSSLIITLEPCCHWGKTPPCTDAIIENKIKEVYIATIDKNEIVNGKGIEALRKAGIKVECGFMEEEAIEINEDFFKWIQTGLPFVTVKYAMTLDGKMATRKHSSKWITSDKSRFDSHILRYNSDAIMVGSNTIKQDNPTLSSRIEGKKKYPLRIILDSDRNVTEEHTVIKDDYFTMLVIPDNNEELEEYYRKMTENRKNKIIVPIKIDNQYIDINALLEKLGDYQIISLIVEGGSRALYSCFKSKVIDKVITYISPKILSGTGLVPFIGIGPEDMEDAVRLKNVKYEIIEDEIKISGYLNL